MSKFEVKNVKIESALRGIAKVIKKILPQGWGFTLLLFDYGDKGSMFYISSAKRADMVKALIEFIKKQNDENGRTS